MSPIFSLAEIENDDLVKVVDIPKTLAEPTRRHVASFRVSITLLAKLLHLPSDTAILKIEAEPWHDTVLMYVEQPGLPEVAEGGAPREVSPILTRSESGEILFDWGI